MLLKYKRALMLLCGSGTIVGVATGYGLEGPVIEFRWGWEFQHLSRPVLGPTQPPTQRVPDLFPGGKERQRRDADPSPLLVPWSRKSKAIRLLPLWAVRPVRSLSACTRVHFTFNFTLPYALICFRRQNVAIITSSPIKMTSKHIPRNICD